MTTIGSLGQKFDYTAAEIPQQPITPTSPVRNEDQPWCEFCGECEVWMDSCGKVVRCEICEPPPSESLVHSRWFIDDHGNRWNVVAENDGIHYRKATGFRTS